MLTVEILFKLDDTMLAHMAKLALNKIIDEGLAAVTHNSSCCQALDEFYEAVKGKGIWAYRGNHHVALHFMRADETPWNERAAIIKAEL